MQWASLGAIISTVISELVCCIILLAVYCKNHSFAKIFTAVWKYILSGVIMFFSLYVFNFYVQIEQNYLAIICDVCIGAAMYIVLLLLLKEDYTIKFLKKIRKVVIIHGKK